MIKLKQICVFGLMVGQTPLKQKNVSRLVTCVFTRQGNTILDKLLFPWLDFFFLDLRSEGLSSLASLGRQLYFFPTISEKKVQSRKEKFVLNCIPCLVTLCHQAGIYIPAGQRRELYIPYFIFKFFVDDRKCQFNDKSSNPHDKNCQLSQSISI